MLQDDYNRVFILTPSKTEPKTFESYFVVVAHCLYMQIYFSHKVKYLILMDIYFIPSNQQGIYTKNSGVLHFIFALNGNYYGRFNHSS